MELLVVMSIMGLLLTLGTVGYFSAISGMAQRSAVEHLMSTLTVARQRACMDATRVGVVWFNESLDGSKTNVVPTYIVCKAVGRVSRPPEGDFIYDEFTPLDEMFGTATSSLGSKLKGIRIFNMTQGTMSFVIPNAMPYQSESGISLPSPYGKLKGGADKLNGFTFYGLERHSSSSTWSWKSGDVYGVAATEPYTLPKGIVFDSLDDQETTSIDRSKNCIWFYPDGRVEGCTIKLSDTKQGKSCSFTVNNDGSITPQGRVDWK
jgi:type II secretory pathway pseudopilin PulG